MKFLFSKLTLCIIFSVFIAGFTSTIIINKIYQNRLSNPMAATPKPACIIHVANDRIDSIDYDDINNLLIVANQPKSQVHLVDLSKKNFQKIMELVNPYAIGFITQNEFSCLRISEKSIYEKWQIDQSLVLERYDTDVPQTGGLMLDNIKTHHLNQGIYFTIKCYPQYYICGNEYHSFKPVFEKSETLLEYAQQIDHSDQDKWNNFWTSTCYWDISTNAQYFFFCIPNTICEYSLKEQCLVSKITDIPFRISDFICSGNNCITVCFENGDISRYTKNNDIWTRKNIAKISNKYSNIQSGRLFNNLNGNEIAFLSYQEKCIYVISKTDASVKIYNYKYGNPLTLVFSKSGKKIAVGMDNGYVIIWDL